MALFIPIFVFYTFQPCSPRGALTSLLNPSALTHSVWITPSWFTFGLCITLLFHEHHTHWLTPILSCEDQRQCLLQLACFPQKKKKDTEKNRYGVSTLKCALNEVNLRKLMLLSCFWSSHCGSVKTNPDCYPWGLQVRSLASLSGLRIRRCRGLWHRSQTQLRSGIAGAMGIGW